MDFQVGQVVEWQSQANGTTVTKRGEVLAVIAPNTYMCGSDLIQILGFDYKRRFNVSSLGWGDKRNHTSYLIAVPGKTSKAKPKLYWPRVSALKATLAATERKEG